MTVHSPDHAERAREVLAEQLGQNADRLVAIEVAMQTYADERVAAALRGRDRVVEDLTTALHDAISRPAGVVPASAEPFYDWRRYDRGPVIREIAA